jgi:hypothetical protein
MPRKTPTGEPLGGGRGMLSEVAGTTGEDPFGPGDPLEVARLVRRALAAAGRRATDVTDLMVVTDVTPSPEALDRFTRRALGPHGAVVRSSSQVVATALRHQERLAIPGRSDAYGSSVVVTVALGPGAIATARCHGASSGG